jgi:hypothetical protein
MTPELLDLIGIVTGAVLTLLILSYVLGIIPSIVSRCTCSSVR